MNTHKQSGFTLIELMIVVTIIGILAAVAVPVYQDYTIRARVGEVSSVLTPVKTATTLYYSSEGAFPTTLDDLTSVSNNTTHYETEYVNNLNLTGDATDGANVIIKLQDDTKLGDAADKQVIYKATSADSVIQWEVMAFGSTSTTDSTVPAKYLPGS